MDNIYSSQTTPRATLIRCAETMTINATDPCQARLMVDTLLTLTDRAAGSLLFVPLDQEGRSCAAPVIVTDIDWNCSPGKRAATFTWLGHYGWHSVLVGIGSLTMAPTTAEQVWAQAATHYLSHVGVTVVATYLAHARGVEEITPHGAAA